MGAGGKGWQWVQTTAVENGLLKESDTEWCQKKKGGQLEEEGRHFESVEK